MGTRFDTLIRACLEEMNEDPHPVTGVTTAAGTTGSLVDTDTLKDTSAEASATRFVGQWLRFMDSGTPSVENIRKIKTYAPDTGTLVPESNFDNAPGSGKTYERHEKLHPARLKACINDILAELRYQDILPLTLVADGDMEDTGTVTDKWGNDQNGTPLKDTSYVLFGRQSLKVTAGAANGYTYPKTNTPVTPGETLIVWAPAYGDQKGAKLVLYDVTNAAEIESGEHYDEGWGLLYFTCTVPEGCYEVRPHLVTVTNGGAVYWDHVGILKQAQKVYPSPSWLGREQNLIRVVSFPYGSSLTSANADNAYRLFTRSSDHEHCVASARAERGVVPLRLTLGQAPSDPLFVVGKRKGYPALSADADETEADGTLVKCGAVALAFRRLGREYGGEAGYWARIFNGLRPEEEPPQELHMISSYRR